MAEAGCEARQAAQLPSLACSLHDTHTPHSASRKEDPTRAEVISEIMPSLKGSASCSARPDDFHRYPRSSHLSRKARNPDFYGKFPDFTLFPFRFNPLQPKQSQRADGMWPRAGHLPPSLSGQLSPRTVPFPAGPRPWGVLSLVARRESTLQTTAPSGPLI